MNQVVTDRARQAEFSPLVCPACGGANPGDAVFCGNAKCGKALGDFRYVREEVRNQTSWHEAIADRVATFIGKPQFLVAHSIWFGVWAVINTGIVTLVGVFDEYPFGLLGIILAIEAIFVTGFLLISQNRQNAHADKRAELDYEVNVKTFRRINQIDEMMRQMLDRLAALESQLADGRGS